MFKVCNSMYLFFIAGYLGASQPDTVKKVETGKDRLSYYKKIAKKRAKQGYRKSVLSGASTGAKIGAVGAGILTLAGSKQGKVVASKPITDLRRGILAPFIAATAGGATIGGLMSLWQEAFRKNSTPGWIEQINLLAENKGQISDTLLKIGAPSDVLNMSESIEGGRTPKHFFMGSNKYARKVYLLASGYNDVLNLLLDNHYELYLMPIDNNLVDIFMILIDESNTNLLKKYVAFIAIRPTPGITKSSYNGKVMPRIIIGFKPEATNKDVSSFVESLIETLKGYHPVLKEIALNETPRYSQKLNDLMYVGYGSPDYKESKEGKMAYASKATTRWQRWISGASDEDMAYKDDTYRLDVQQQVCPVSFSRPLVTDSETTWLKFYKDVYTARYMDLVCAKGLKKYLEGPKIVDEIMNVLKGAVEEKSTGAVGLLKYNHDLALLIREYMITDSWTKKQKLKNDILLLEEMRVNEDFEYDTYDDKIWNVRDELNFEFEGDYPVFIENKLSNGPFPG